MPSRPLPSRPPLGRPSLGRPPPSRRLILCADDFALDEAVSAGILRLVEAGRLSAVSCFADAPSWPAAGAELRRHAGSVELGLHFNLTQRFGFGERPLAHWMGAALLGALDAAAVRRHLLRQIEAFREVVGAPPRYIDGHQHVHAFPGIRAVVAAAAAELGGAAPIPLRDVRRFFGPTDAPIKRRVIAALARAGRPAPGGTVFMNAAMAGDYSLTPAADYARLFAGWLAEAPEGALVMCHPAAEAAGHSAGARELAFLESEAAGALLERFRIELAPA